MTKDWEDIFSGWYGRASDAEQRRYENTCNSINEALRGHPALNAYAFDVYPKGSYPAFTNVVRDSDVDIAAELTTLYETEFIHEAKTLTLSDVGGTPYTGDATLAGFKDDVHKALVAAFGASSLERGSKAVHIHESSRNLKADVVPCVTHKTWVARASMRQGIRLRDDKRPTREIVNYPKQHLAEGTKKNDATSRRYKRVVRILKRLENEMVDHRVITPVPSFLIESAVYNAPNDAFVASTWTRRIEAVLAHIYHGTTSDSCVCSNDWLEVNRCKYLFSTEQSWSRQTANTFALEAWNYAGLG